MADRKTDRMKAIDGMDKLFSGASGSSSGGSKKSTGRKTKTEPEKGSEEPKKAVKRVFSFRAPEDQVKSWRVWADAKGLKVDELGEKALTEYIKKHGLTKDQKQIYELKMAQKEGEVKK